MRMQVPGLEAQKIRASAPSNATRNNIVNVAPQWNTERWQRQQQHQQRQQQLYAAASSAAPAVRPGICPPISVTQFYPPNYAVRNDSFSIKHRNYLRLSKSIEHFTILISCLERILPTIKYTALLVYLCRLILTAARLSVTTQRYIPTATTLITHACIPLHHR